MRKMLLGRLFRSLQQRDATAQGVARTRHMETIYPIEGAQTRLFEDPYAEYFYAGSAVTNLLFRWVGPKALFGLMSNEIRADRELHMLLSKKSADDRVASLPLSLAARQQRRGLSARRFRLPMSRYDIANYLGLAVETVSRIFTRFQQQKTLWVDGREVEILDRETLCGSGRLGVEA